MTIRTKSNPGRWAVSAELSATVIYDLQNMFCLFFIMVSKNFFIEWVLILYLDTTLTMLYWVETLSLGMFYFLSCFSFCLTFNAPSSWLMHPLGDLPEPFLTHPWPKWCLWPWSLSFCLVSLSVNRVNSIPAYQMTTTHMHTDAL